MQIAKRLVLVVTTLALSGCADFKQYVSVSPDGRSRILLREPSWFRGGGIQIVLFEDQMSFELYQVGGDNGFTTAEVYWSPDGRIVGLFNCGGPPSELAVYRATRGPAPFAEVWPSIREQLRTRFRLGELDDDALKEWVCLNGSKTNLPLQ